MTASASNMQKANTAYPIEQYNCWDSSLLFVELMAGVPGIICPDEAGYSGIPISGEPSTSWYPEIPMSECPNIQVFRKSGYPDLRISGNSTIILDSTIILFCGVLAHPFVWNSLMWPTATHSKVVCFKACVSICWVNGRIYRYHVSGWSRILRNSDIRRA